MPKHKVVGIPTRIHRLARKNRNAIRDKLPMRSPRNIGKKGTIPHRDNGRPRAAGKHLKGGGNPRAKRQDPRGKKLLPVMMKMHIITKTTHRIEWGMRRPRLVGQPRGMRPQHGRMPPAAARPLQKLARAM